jgi:hypothetical protein
VAYGVEEGEGLAGGLALPAAVAGDEEALHAGAERVRPLPHRLPVGKELALPPTTTLGASSAAAAAGGHLFSRDSSGPRGFCGGWGKGYSAEGEAEAVEVSRTPRLPASQCPALENRPIIILGVSAGFIPNFKIQLNNNVTISP